MTAVAVTDEQAWLDERRHHITASDIARAVTGQYGGAYAVVADKLGLTTPDAPTQVQQRGHRWEPRIADTVTTLTGLHVVGEQTFVTGPHQLACTVDGFLADKPQVTLDQVVAELEAKTVRVGTPSNWAYWNAQVQTQLLVTGLPRALVAVATIDDSDDTCLGVRLTWVDADPFEHEHIANLAGDLWAHVTAGTLPEPVDPSALPTVKTVHRAADPDLDTVDLDPLEADLARLADVKAAVKAVEGERDAIEARIRHHLGAATKGTTTSGWRVSLSAPARVLADGGERWLLEQRPDLATPVLDRARAKAEAPDLYEQAREPIGARRLTVNPPKGQQ